MNLIGLALLGTAFLIAAAAWLAMTVYVYVSAERFGMTRPWVWALGVFLTGPVGLIAFLIDRPEARLAPCPRCRRAVPENAPCPYCGAPPP